MTEQKQGKIGARAAERRSQRRHSGNSGHTYGIRRSTSLKLEMKGLEGVEVVEDLEDVKGTPRVDLDNTGSRANAGTYSAIQDMAGV